VSGTLVTRRVVEEIKLMVVLRIEPFSSLGDLSGDLRPVGVEMFLLHFLGHPQRNVFLRGGIVEDGRAILCRTIALRRDDNERGGVYSRVPRSFPCLSRVVGSCVR